MIPYWQLYPSLFNYTYMYMYMYMYVNAETIGYILL